MKISNTIRRTGKRTIVRTRSYFNHRIYRYQAKTTFDNITLHKPRVSSSVLRQCDEYAREVLGSKKHAPWLKAYTQFCGEFREGWIPNSYYSDYIVQQLKGEYGKLSNSKAVSRRLLGNTPLIPDLASSVNGLFHTSDGEPIVRAALADYLFAQCDKIVFKIDDSRQGRGVFVYDRSNFPANRTQFSNGVFQSFIQQHEFFNQFSSNGVATIRLITVVDDGGVASCRSALVRIPRQADSHVKTASAIKVAIDMDSGTLFDSALMSNMSPLSHHPDSNHAFTAQTIPGFHKCMEACTALQAKMPFARTIGWDLAIGTDENPVIMEWNGVDHDLFFSEVMQGPCFADLGWEKLWREGKK